MPVLSLLTPFSPAEVGGKQSRALAITRGTIHHEVAMLVSQRQVPGLQKGWLSPGICDNTFTACRRDGWSLRRVTRAKSECL